MNRHPRTPGMQGATRCETSKTLPLQGEGVCLGCAWEPPPTLATRHTRSPSLTSTRPCLTKPRCLTIAFAPVPGNQPPSGCPVFSVGRLAWPLSGGRRYRQCAQLNSVLMFRHDTGDVTCACVIRSTFREAPYTFYALICKHKMLIIMKPVVSGVDIVPTDKAQHIRIQHTPSNYF